MKRSNYYVSRLQLLFCKLAQLIIVSQNYRDDHNKHWNVRKRSQTVVNSNEAFLRLISLISQTKDEIRSARKGTLA